MARITFSPLVTAASGKVKDTVFSRWKGRAYIRARVTPANPQSAAQTLVRNSLSRCVDMWQSNVSKIKTAWNLYASPYSMSGYNKFMSANRADEQAANELQTTPVNTDVLPVDTYTAVSGGASGEIDLAWDNGTVGATYKVFVMVRKAGDDFFTVESDGAVLTSVKSLTLTGLAAGISYQVYLSNEENTDDLFSESVSDTCLALA